jgi:predicted transcriptional regulator
MMVNVTVQIDDDVMEALRAQASARGSTVAEWLAGLATAAVTSEAGIAFTPEQEDALFEADEAVERGEWFSKDQVLADLKALRR